ncbi:MAG TPA: DUF3619 family protein [Gammaproteobacteria bacterium]
MEQTDTTQAVFAERLRRQLDTTTAQLDAATLLHLRQGRERALEAARRKRQTFFDRWPLHSGLKLSRPALITAGAFGLTVAVLLLVVPVLQIQLPAPDLPLASLEDDLEIVFADDEVNFYEDMEFLIWLEQQDHAS